MRSCGLLAVLGALALTSACAGSLLAPGEDVGPALLEAAAAAERGQVADAAQRYVTLVRDEALPAPQRAAARYRLALLRLGDEASERDPNEALELLEALAAEAPGYQGAEVTALRSLLRQIDEQSASSISEAARLRALRREVDGLSAEVSAREAELQAREAALAEREAALESVTDSLIGQ